MKRKASELDDGPKFGAWSPSSNYSASSNDSPSRHHGGFETWTHLPKQYALSSSHMNLRTRKRFRDDRPDIDVVHQNTLAKLFDAQRQQFTLLPSTAESDRIGEAVIPEVSIEPTQKSLHSFFSISHARAPKTSLETPKAQSPSDVQNMCDDCGNALDPSLEKSSGDAEMMDLDQRRSVFYEEDFECASCHRNVCDTCAVRGDERICLECAMPGGG